MTEEKKAIALVALANLFLFLIKFSGGIFGNSIALIADGFYSLSDFITDGFVYFSHGVGQMPPDKNHPYVIGTPKLKALLS